MEYTIQAKQGGQYDVVVCGGGTAGCIAAIASARQGMRTLLLERTFTVGGMLTLGDAGITKFSEHCRDVDKYKKEVLDVLGSNPRSVQVAGGIAHEYVMRMLKEGTALGTNGDAGSYIFTDKCAAQWTLMDMLSEANVEVLYDTVVCMAICDKSTIKGVVVLNKDGFTEYHADCVIDTTGDADVAALAGVPFRKGAAQIDLEEGGAHKEGEMQAFGTMFRVADVDFKKLYDYMEKNPDRFFQHEFGVMSLENARQSHEKGDMSVFRLMIDLPDGTRSPVQVYNLPAKGEAILLGYGCGYSGDGLNASSISKGQESIHQGVRKLMEMMHAYPGFENARVTYVPDVGIRETRHIDGEYLLRGLDVLTGKDFEDSIGCGGHPIDIHPLPPEVENMDMNHWRFHIPYKIMVPQKIKNLLVSGRCVSATRMASGAIRPTVQCMLMGEAAGVAASLAVRNKVTPGQIDVQELRKILEAQGAIL